MDQHLSIYWNRGVTHMMLQLLLCTCFLEEINENLKEKRWEKAYQLTT